MKKSMYWLAVLMLGLSCALWTGCSDDDNDDNPGGGSNGGNGGKDDEVEVVDTVYQVKTIKLEGINIELEYADGKVKTIKTQRGVNPMPDATVEYAADAVTVNYSAFGMDRKVVFTLENGYAKQAQSYDMSVPDDPYEESVYDFTYNTSNGMLESIVSQDDPETPLYLATYAGTSKNWATLACFELGAIMDCKPGKLENNYSVDANEFLFNYGQDEVIDYAILCGLIPATENVIESLSGVVEEEGGDEEEMRRLTKAGETVVEIVPAENKGQISKLEMKISGQTFRTIEFGY